LKSFLQTKKWGEFQESLGRKVWSFDNDGIRANIIEYDMPFGRNYLYIPHGPNISLDDIEGGLKNKITEFVNYLKKISSDSGSIFVKIEPLNDSVIELLHEYGFRKSKKEIQPSKTVIVNLRASEDELLSLMHHKTRYNIKIAEKNNLVFIEGGNVEDFWKLLKQTSEKDNFSPHEKGYYEKLLSFFGNGEIRTKLYFIKQGDKLIAGMIALTYGVTAYYLHGAMDRDHRSMMAPYMLHWEAMRLFKSQGLTFYDFWGVDSTKWPGVTRFKMGWGGNVVEYPGSFDLPISKFWYLIYNITRNIIYSIYGNI
jgi:lipid II:glycine glycyltransferase (peptidoglycan interpeptide bridge formation enzyme)